MTIDLFPGHTGDYIPSPLTFQVPSSPFSPSLLPHLSSNCPILPLVVKLVTGPLRCSDSNSKVHGLGAVIELDSGCKPQGLNSHNGIRSFKKRSKRLDL